MIWIKITLPNTEKNIYEFGMFLYQYMNIKTALNVIVRDDKYFEDINLTYYSIYKPFIDKEDINVILNKIAKKEKLDNKEKTTLVDAFNKGSLDYKNDYHKSFMFMTNGLKKVSLSLESVIYQADTKNGEHIYLYWRDGSVE